MKYEIVQIDSIIWGRNVLALYEINPSNNLLATEEAYVSEYNPAYVSVRLALDDLNNIHQFQRLGFEFMEVQLRIMMPFKSFFNISQSSYQYHQVTTSSQLAEILPIAQATILHDRFSIDPGVPVNFSGRRYEAYVRQSFESDNEEVWRLFDPRHNLTLGFRTYRWINKEEVLFLLGGIHPKFKKMGLGVLLSHYCFNHMLNRGVKRSTTHISAINKPIFDLEVSHFGFRYQQAFAILRKLYT